MDHPTENDATDLALSAEPATQDAGADGNAATVALSPPLPVGVDGVLADAEPGVGGLSPAPAEHDGSEGGEAIESSGEPAEASGAGDEGAVAVVGELAADADESETVAEPGGDAIEAAESAAAAEPTSSASSLELGESVPQEEVAKDWYILKVQVNREDSIRDALLRRIKIEGLEEFFGDIIVPTEEVAEFNKSGKRRVVRRKLYPGYILVHMVINDDTWFLVRETPGVGDFTGSAGKPTPMEPRDVERILRLGAAQEERGGQIKTAIPFKAGDRVRVKDGHFQNFEGEVDAIDEANGRITVMINIFNRSTPVELEHWQVESV